MGVLRKWQNYQWVDKAMTLYWIDTRWACGGIYAQDGIVKSGAPIFRKFIGQRIQDLSRSYKIMEVKP